MLGWSSTAADFGRHKFRQFDDDGDKVADQGDDEDKNTDAVGDEYSSKKIMYQNNLNPYKGPVTKRLKDSPEEILMTSNRS